MRQNAAGKEAPLLAMADELVERLARLEEQMRHIAQAVEKLSGRDSELDASLRALSDRFNEALSAQAEAFRESLADIAQRFVSREDWAFWKSLLTAALLALIAYGWSTLISIRG
jgi:predicted nuclease with TOPRIM domain